MTLVAAMIEYLKAQSAVSDLVGDRIYPMYAPAAARMPYAVLQLISGAPERHMAAQSDLSAARVQINIHAATPRDADRVADAVYGELGGYPGGTMGSDDVAVHVRSITLEGRGDLPVEAADASEAHGYGRRQDYQVWYRETVPTFA